MAAAAAVPSLRSLLPVRSSRLAVFASGAGTTAEALMIAGETGQIAPVVLVIGNNSHAEVFTRAAAHRVVTRHISTVTHPDERRRDEAMLSELSEHAVTHVVLAGYMKRLGPATLDAYRGRCFNTHPALLPAFGGAGMYGPRVHSAVLASGVKVTGATVHLVTADYDDGPILAQTEVPVMAGDDITSLAARVGAAEKELLIHTLRRVASR